MLFRSRASSVESTDWIPFALRDLGPTLHRAATDPSLHGPLASSAWFQAAFGVVCALTSLFRPGDLRILQWIWRLERSFRGNPTGSYLGLFGVFRSVFSWGFRVLKNSDWERKQIWKNRLAIKRDRAKSFLATRWALPDMAVPQSRLQVDCGIVRCIRISP